MDSDLYLGRWRLLPELCLYQHGDVPRSGRYEISAADGNLSIAISWVDAQGNPQETEFGGAPDGSINELGAPGITFSLTRIDSATLDSAAFQDGVEVAYARRCAAMDGSLLATVQTGTTPEGQAFRNFQVYRRDGD